MLPRLRTISCCALALCLISGCHRGVKHQLSAVSHFDQGAPVAALAALDKAAELRGAEQEIIATDRAIAALMTGDPATCEAPLRKTRDRLNFLRQTDLREKTRAIVTDDKAVAWSGREFEQRMIDNLLILSSLMGNRQDAFAFANQAMEHVFEDRSTLLPTNAEGHSVKTVGHSELPEQRPTARYSANAFSAYLHAGIRSENPMDQDITANAIRQVGFWNPGPNQSEPSGFGTLSPRGQGVVHVITFVGRVTDWTAERSIPTTSALLLADQILSAVGDHTVPPTVAPVQIAKPVAAFSPQPLVTHARVAGTQERVSATLVDLNQAAHDSYVANRDQQIARAVARRVVKKGAIYAAKEQLAVAGGSGADIVLNLGGIAWEALEKADTRHLQLLPARIEVLQLTLPAGLHQLELSSGAAGERGGKPTEVRVPVIVDDGRNTFVLCFRPHDQLAGNILTSDGTPPVQLQ
jgi:uncharacterized protein